MKKCNACGAQVDEQTKFCPRCGSAELIQEPVAPVYNPTSPAQNEDNIDKNDNGNILAGIVGAFLFSIIGGFLYFVIYQMGIIAGICGLVIFILANFGYGLFAKTKNKNSIVGLIASIICMLVMIFLAEYFCISFEIYQVYKDMGITFFDAVRATPEFLAEPEIASAVAEDLVFAYIFGVVASISNIVNIIKARKNK